jgi:hypothetical protein
MLGPTVEVACGRCGCTFELSDRRERAHRTAGTSPKCMTCRRPPNPMTPAERERYLTWWLYESGLEVDELIEIATLLAENETWGRVAA